MAQLETRNEEEVGLRGPQSGRTRPCCFLPLPRTAQTPGALQYHLSQDEKPADTLAPSQRTAPPCSGQLGQQGIASTRSPSPLSPTTRPSTPTSKQASNAGQLHSSVVGTFSTPSSASAPLPRAASSPSPSTSTHEIRSRRLRPRRHRSHGVRRPPQHQP